MGDEACGILANPPLQGSLVLCRVPWALPRADILRPVGAGPSQIMGKGRKWNSNAKIAKGAENLPVTWAVAGNAEPSSARSTT